MMSRVCTRGALLAAVALLILPQGAAAQDAWPAKRVNVLVGFAAGGFADSVARIIARGLGDKWKQSVVVQNMAGAGGNTAARNVSGATPDGYTLLLTTTSLAINETLYKDKGFTGSGLTAIAIPVEAPEMIAANPKAGIKSFEDVIAAAKAGKLFLGSSGIGTGSHIVAEYFFRALAKVEAKHIPFQGGNPAMLALLNGDVNIMASTATAISGIKSGELVGIAVASSQRNPIVPNVPTYAELGYPGFEASSWAGFFAPVGTPEAVLDLINADINQVLKDPEAVKQFETMGVLTKTRSRTDTVAFMAKEIPRWGNMVTTIGLRSE